MYQATVTQVNAVKDYKHGRKFFVRALGTGTEYMIMFHESHYGKFKVRDEITFDAKVSPARKPGDPDWYSVTAPMRVQRLGAGQINTEEREFDVIYVGLPKDRDNKPPSSFGLVGEDWALELPVSVVEAYFTGTAIPEEEIPVLIGSGFYAILKISQMATPIEIKKAYRILARQYHPDVSDLPDTEKRFAEIHEAYKLLSDPSDRKKHDAWLTMMGTTDESWGSVTRTTVQTPGQFFRPPYRCGKIKAVVEYLGSVWRAKKILSWEVRKTEMWINVSFQDVRFNNWGVDIAGIVGPGFVARSVSGQKYGSFEIDNTDLPFRSSEELMRKKLTGTLKVKIAAHQVSIWSRATMTATRFWDVDKTLAVLIDATPAVKAMLK